MGHWLDRHAVQCGAGRYQRSSSPRDSRSEQCGACTSEVTIAARVRKCRTPTAVIKLTDYSVLAGVATKLMQACISRWTELKCHKAVLLHASDAGRAVYSRVGFGEGNMLIKDLAESEPPLRPPLHGGTFTVAPAGAEADGIVARNWQSLWAEAGVSVDMMVSDCTETTAAFLAQARETLEGQTYVSCIH